MERKEFGVIKAFLDGVEHEEGLVACGMSGRDNVLREGISYLLSWAGFGQSFLLLAFLSSPSAARIHIHWEQAANSGCRQLTTEASGYIYASFILTNFFHSTPKGDNITWISTTLRSFCFLCFSAVYHQVCSSPAIDERLGISDTLSF